jgi:hypothetical protein
MFDACAGQPGAQRSMIFGGFPAQVRYMSSDLSALPDITDGGILKALHALLGTSWTKIEPSVRDAVEASLKSNSDDVVGKDALTDAWRAAEAVEKFGGNTLQELLLEITDLSGGTGEVSLLGFYSNFLHRLLLHSVIDLFVFKLSPSP